ncbi:MAG: protein kinase, partial [Myxococcota bacterium]
MGDAPRYHAVRKIADGGSAEVFLGEQQGAAGFRRPVVLKRIRPALYADEQFREMLVEEAHLAMSLHHPNLVEVLDLGESNGRYFLVLELVDGWTLGQVARRGREAGLPMPLELCVYVAAEVCRGLAYAHQRTRGGKPLGVVHRDICPNNILVSINADVKVADFGIARANSRPDDTRPGMIRGKPMYMSPEQTRAEPLDARSDLFSVGTVLYTLLTGQLPFPGPSDQEYLAQISNTDAPSPDTVRKDLPKELCRLVQKAMARKKEERFGSAQEMLFALEHVQRTALKPAGRSELEAWLRTLTAKDGQTPILKQTLPPAPPPDEPEWISLSAEQAVVEDQTATQRALPHFPTPRKAKAKQAPLWPVVLVTALVVGGAGLWWTRSRPRPPPPVPVSPPVASTTQAPPAARTTPPVEEFAEYPGAKAAETSVDAGDTGTTGSGAPGTVTGSGVTGSGAPGSATGSGAVGSGPPGSAAGSGVPGSATASGAEGSATGSGAAGSGAPGSATGSGAAGSATGSGSAGSGAPGSGA